MPKVGGETVIRGTLESRGGILCVRYKLRSYVEPKEFTIWYGIRKSEGTNLEGLPCVLSCGKVSYRVGGATVVEPVDCTAPPLENRSNPVHPPRVGKGKSKAVYKSGRWVFYHGRGHWSECEG